MNVITPQTIPMRQRVRTVSDVGADVNNNTKTEEPEGTPPTGSPLMHAVSTKSFMDMANEMVDEEKEKEKEKKKNNTVDDGLDDILSMVMEVADDLSSPD